MLQDVEMSRNALPVPFGIDRFFPTGGVASNNMRKGFQLPCHQFDGVLHNDGDGDIYLLGALRSAFEHGGFPFWGKFGTRKRMLSALLRHLPAYAELKPVLTEGLLPV
jgi:hypothetical protein